MFVADLLLAVLLLVICGCAHARRLPLVQPAWDSPVAMPVSARCARILLQDYSEVDPRTEVVVGLTPEQRIIRGD
jgi:hypothetical protein